MDAERFLEELAPQVPQIPPLPDAHEVRDYAEQQTHYLLSWLWHNPVTQYTFKCIYLLCRISFLAFLFLGAAVVLYTILYRLLVPEVEHQYPLYFDFSQALYLKEALKNGNTYPLGESKQLALELPNTIVALTDQDAFLTRGISYRTSIFLELPETQENFDAGIFMVSLCLADGRPAVERRCQRGETQTPILEGECTCRQRPASLRYRSWPLRVARSTLFFLPLLWGLVDETQTITVDIFSDL